MIRGVFFIILSGIAFFIVNFFVKTLGNPSTSLFPYVQKYPAHELVFARSLISFSISAYIIKRRGLSLLGNNRRWLLLRGTAGMVALTLFFFTLHELPLAIASTLQYLSPIFTVLIAAKLFKEQVNSVQYLSSLAAFGGVVLIAYTSTTDTTNPISLFWIVIGVISAVLSGVAYNAISKLKETEEPINIVIYFPMIALPITLVWCFFDAVIPLGIEWLFLLLIGVFTQIAQVLMTKAFMMADTALVAPFQYFGAIYALVSGWFIFDEHLEWISLIGILIIIVAVVIGTIFRKGVKSKVRS